MPQTQVLIVGGGMAGLSTAYELHRRGVRFTLLEASGRAGGVVLSEEVEGGFTIDAGPDALLAQKPEGVRLCEELGLGSRLMPTKPPRLAFIQRGGELHALPGSSVLGVPTRIGPFVRTRLFSWPGKLRMAAEVAVPRRTSDSDESIGEFMTRRFGAEAATYLAEPLLAGIHAGDVSRLSTRALFPRFVEAERKHGSLLLAFRRERAAQPPDEQGAFRSLPGGLSELVRALAASLPAGDLRFRAAVTKVTPSAGGGYRIETGAGETWHAAAAVLAAPAWAAAQQVRDAQPQLADLCDGIPYTSTATIVLGFERTAVQHPLNGSGFVVPKIEATGILAASWLSSKWQNRAPAGRVLLRAFAGGARDPHALERSDAELVTLALDALRPLLRISGHPILTRVYRWTRSSAQHEVGHLERLARIEAELAKQPGLFITGSGYRGVGIPDCVADGRATGKQVTEWLATHRHVS